MMGGGFILALFIFHQAILTQFAVWSIHAYSVAKWGTPLKYKEIQLQWNQLVIVKPRFKHDSSFSAEKINLNWRIQLSKRQLYLDIEMEHPHWHFEGPISSRWDKWQKLFVQEENWFKMDPHFSFQEGIVSWNFDDVSHSLKFDLGLNKQEGGYLKLYFEPSEKNEQQFFTFQLLKNAQGVEVDCHCESVGCCSLISLAQFLGIDLAPWMISSGQLQGDIKTIFPGGSRPYLEGELLIKNLVFHRLDNPLKGNMEEIKLEFKKNENAYAFHQPFLTTIGSLEILKPATLSYQSPAQAWDIHHILGYIQLDDFDVASVNLQAKGGYYQEPSDWILKGNVNLNAERSPNLDLELLCIPKDRPEGQIHLALNQLQSGSKHIEVQCEKLSYAECSFLQSLLSTHWPIFSEILLEDGELNACIEANLEHQGIKELFVKQLTASHLSTKVKPWNMSCDFSQVRAHGKVNLGHVDFWQSLQAGLHLEDGKILFEDLSPPLPMTDIQAHLLIHKGEVEHSLITLQVAGLKGTMDVEWGGQKHLLTFKLDGVVQDVSDLFPIGLQEGIRNHFYHNRLMVLANLKRHQQQVELGGTLHIQHTNMTEQMDLIHFGCEFKKIDSVEEGKFAPTGWFYAPHLPLEKYLSPFIFRNGILKMSGEAEFKGSFDDQFLSIKYDADDLKIENEDLCIEVPRLHASIPGQLVGSHHMNLDTYVYEGTLPIQSGSYLEKNTGLLFQDIQGMISFTNGLVRIQPMEASCGGIDFAGELELDYKDPAPGVFDVMIHCPFFSGKINQVQQLLAHLGQSSILYRIPLDGDVSGKGNGLQLKFSFIPQDYRLQASIQGMIHEGYLSFEGFDVALKGIYMDVDYDHEKERLECSDIQGALLVGKPRRVEEYLLVGKHIYLYPLNRPNLDFDIAFLDKGHELLRLVGKTDDVTEEIKSLYLNPTLSHLSSIYPNIWECQLRDWSRIEQLDFQSTFNLAQVLGDLKRFRQTGLWGLSHTMIDKISQFSPLEGEGMLGLKYGSDQICHYHLQGSHIRGGNDTRDHFSMIKGSKQEKKWIIDQIQWDDWSAYAELHQTDQKWRIPFLGLKVGEVLLLGMDGDLWQEELFLKAKLKFCQIDLAKLDDFTWAQPFVTKWWPKGVLNAMGDIEWNILSSNAWDGCQFNLSAEMKNFALRNYPISILNQFQIKGTSHESLKLENLHFKLDDQVNIAVKELDYHLQNEKVRFLDAGFQISHDQLQGVGETFHYHFPDILEQSVKEIISSSKQQGELKGSITIESNDINQQRFTLNLTDGLYSFKNREYDLKQFELQLTGNEIHFSTSTQIERFPFQILGRVNWPSCTNGEWKFLSMEGKQSLVVKWENCFDKKYLIRSAIGEFAGCSVFLNNEGRDLQDHQWTELTGKVSIDFNQIRPLLDISLADSLQKLKLGSLYTIQGSFWINPDQGSSFLDSISFKGKLSSDQAIVKGYQVKKIEGDLQYIPGRLDVQNISVDDPAGNVQVENGVVFLDRLHHQWTFSVPRVTVKNFRPILLRNTEDDSQGNPKFRSLVVKKVELQNVKGNLDNVSTWQGEGMFQFLNSSRKNPIHPLFVIPAEIILRLGLDPHVLNPVTGTIFFNLQGDRLYLKRFKDVYSDGRGSKFYLVGPDPSWVDFDGDLSINVRMKQYNLIFKIAELFTVSIKGDIKKPQYTLQKQSRSSKKSPSTLIP